MVELAQKNTDLVNQLNQDPGQVNPNDVEKQVTKAVTNVANENPAMSTSDPAGRNYMRVFNNVLNRFFRPDPDDAAAVADAKDLSPTAKLLKVRQFMDTLYKQARGAKGAFPGGNIADPAIRSLDAVHSAASGELTKILTETAKNTEVKTALKSEWDLHRAADELWKKAQNEAPSAAGRFAQRHPSIASFGSRIGRSAAIRTLFHL